MYSKKKKLKIGISIGDSNGIGMEIIIKTFMDNRIMEFCTPIIFSSSKMATTHRKILNITDFRFNTIKSIQDLNLKSVNLINCIDEETEINIGNPTEASAKHALISLKKAILALKNHDIDLLVTAPINKLMIRKIEKKFIGHTEFLENFFEGDATMIMVSELMKIAFVTGHIPFSKVVSSITSKKIIEKAICFNKSLIIDFNIRKPKIAILGLNPHAGENGMLGEEENKIINPAIQELQKRDVLAFGPYPSDSFFRNDNLSSFDGILALYHDQGLIPFKAFSFSDGINYTSGLNIIRTSPVHGTGYDIAGKNIANENSFRQAIFLALSIYQNRKSYSKLTKNSLPIKTEILRNN